MSSTWTLVRDGLTDHTNAATPATCGAAWEWHHATLRRFHEPDREAVRSARAGRESVPVIRGVPNPALADAMWREVESST